jgi:membrane associated rhomboid family serine protease
VIRLELATETDVSPDEEYLAITPAMVNGATARALEERSGQLWALVLEARSIPCYLETDDQNWQLLVPASCFAAAVHELHLYEEENRSWPPPPPAARPLSENTLATLSVLLLLATFYNITRLDFSLPGTSPPDWIDLGNANPSHIREGEWWRLVTALTLHANWLHLFSNLSIGGIFIVSLCRELGSGLAWSLILGSGVLGNLVNALVQPPVHRSIGASTAVFGAVGILAALSMVRTRNRVRKRWLLPAAAALALLAILGTEGQHTDLGAHLFGFVSGLGLGLGAEYLVERFGRLTRRLNALLAVASIMVVVWAWWCALHS